MLIIKIITLPRAVEQICLTIGSMPISLLVHTQTGTPDDANSACVISAPRASVPPELENPHVYRHRPGVCMLNYIQGWVGGAKETKCSKRPNPLAPRETNSTKEREKFLGLCGGGGCVYMASKYHDVTHDECSGYRIYGPCMSPCMRPTNPQSRCLDEIGPK